VAQHQQSGWRPTSSQLLWASGIAALAFLSIVICGYLFGWKWTGLPKRTLWDWLELLIVPIVLVLGGYLFTRSETRRTQEIANQQRILDREIADQRRQDATLQAYLDHMGQLLLDKNHPLRQSKEGDEVRTLAQARTLTELRQLDGVRAGRVLQFLYDAGLITKNRFVLTLFGVDLSEADLRGAPLNLADLRGVILRQAHLNLAFLKEADLEGADLRVADLRWAQLEGAALDLADLRGADLSGEWG
jgi:hypothetical protein